MRTILIGTLGSHAIFLAGPLRRRAALLALACAAFAPAVALAQRARPAAPSAALPASAPRGWVGPARAGRRIPAAPWFGPATLTLSTTQLTFTATDPAAQPLVPANQPLLITFSVPFPLGPWVRWSLSLRARRANFTAATGTIPASAVTWSSATTVLSGNGTAAGNAGAAALTTRRRAVARGREGSAAPFSVLVTCNFVFHDSWTYAPGAYTDQAVLTLAAP